MRSSQWRRRLFVAISTILIFSEITMTMCLKDENVRNEIVGESSSTPAAYPEEESLPASSMVKPTAPFSVRLHLVRHGETESNKSHLVMGQSDSPLTQNGINQAMAANAAFGKKPFWRKYSSDLHRCKMTASVILGLDEKNESDSIMENNNNHQSKIDYLQNYLILDERLRERAKGVREGRDKRLSYDEAMDLFRQERINDGLIDEAQWDMPKLEMEDETWLRVKDWIEEIVNHAYQDYITNKTKSENGQEEVHDVESEYHVLGVTHSGTLRIIIERMVGDQLNHKELKKEETDQDGIKMGRLSIPNTSITKIDIIPQNEIDLDDGKNNLDINVQLSSDENQKVKWKTKLIELTSTKHLHQHSEL